jgi:integrase
VAKKDKRGLVQKPSGTWFFVRKNKWYNLETTDIDEAIIKRDAIKALFITKGRYDKPSKDTFGKWNLFWLNEIVGPGINTKTFDDYKYIIETHINPAKISKSENQIEIVLGDIELKYLEPEDLLIFYNKKRKEKRLSKKIDKSTGQRIPGDEVLSSRTIQKIQFVCNASLKEAVKMRKIMENPNDFLDKNTKAKYKPPEATYLNSEEVFNFLDSIENDFWFPAFVTVLGTGLRLGELVGLRWANVDLVSGTIQIKETRKAVNDEDTGRTKIITDVPKSEKSKRIVPLPVDVIETLKELKKGVRSINGYVFTWSDGRPVRPDYLSKHFKKLIRKFDREDMTFHRLRHSYATMLLEMGEELKTIQENLGHADIATTSSIYAHVLERMKVRAARKLDGFTKRKASQR